ncbi:hypothetical protein Cgig2_021099 [Carnegiea gigantea]|uniref:Ribosomal protein S8 n=1 Tax=Carnegiea gigantea TaxID=171969 RepID=A0A9Q1QBL1_9CARY|nr:hypothetical protein Cgig2_021099 [Carnegiea gigantea]
MVRISVLDKALSIACAMLRSGEAQIFIRPSSKLIINVTNAFVSMLISCYIGDFEYVDDHRARKIVAELNGRLNKYGFGYIVLTTSTGIMDHKEARRKNIGGKVLGSKNLTEVLPKSIFKSPQRSKTRFDVLDLVPIVPNSLRQVSGGCQSFRPTFLFSPFSSFIYVALCNLKGLIFGNQFRCCRCKYLTLSFSFFLIDN